MQPPIAVAVCTRCGLRFESNTSANSARAMLSRHRRERHGARGARITAALTRRTSNRARMRAHRAARSASETALAVDMRVFVLCPLRRERALQLYTRTRAEFIRIGVRCSSIVRLEGCDLQRNRLPRRCAELFPITARRGRRAEPSEIVTVAMFHAFCHAGGALSGKHHPT